jgi:hypothetical protein
MVSFWVIIGLIAAATAVSLFGAIFSILGLGALFSGAIKAVFGMGASLEFAKFVLAAYLHQRWKFLNLLFKSYLTSAVVVLSLITSMGIFGFLSDAYTSASQELETENIRLVSLQADQSRVKSEISRITKSIDEIPANRVTKKIQTRQEYEPALKLLNQDLAGIEKRIGDVNLQIAKVKQKVGPLIYISKAFNMGIDDVVKYLILLFVVVFDPLAICLVIATSEALQSREVARKSFKSQSESEINSKSQSVSEARSSSISSGEGADAEQVITMSFSNDEVAESPSPAESENESLISASAKRKDEVA